LLGRFQSYRDGAMPLYAAIRFSKVRKKLYVIIPENLIQYAELDNVLLRSPFTATSSKKEDELSQINMEFALLKKR
ncbi:hypothetical protein, partial [Parafannyhessea umbonata]|uniref:hypothetical protein n=1 Tax=Parafannyhessea umbonata TaxID=604330 RepID=UPI001C408FEA